METPVLKMQRAKKHLDALEEAIGQFTSRKPSPYRARAYDDLIAGERVIKLTIDDFSLDLGILAGDFVANLRSSLDWLAWQLASLSGKRPSDTTCFPIIAEYSAGAEGKIRAATVGIPSRAVAIMRVLQPYNYPNAFKDTHLWRLNKLWNIDKHRHLVSSIASMELCLNAAPDVTIMRRDMHDGSEVRFPLSAKDKVSFDPERSGAKFAIGDEAEGIELTHADLLEIYEFVSGKVFPRFNRFFT